MARYIDAERLCREVFASWDKDTHKTIEASRVHRQEHIHLVRIIEKQPIADVVEVKHGKWIEIGLQNPRCSYCNHYTLLKGNYCGNCGAKMDINEREEK